MSDRIKQDTIKKLQTKPKELQNPFTELETILGQLDEIEGSLENDVLIEKLPPDISEPKLSDKQEPNKFQVEEQRLEQVLNELGDLFVLCQECGRGTLKDELIAGLCFICHNQKELNTIESQLKQSKDNYLFSQLIERLGELEAQVKSIEDKQQEFASSNFLTGIMDEINRNLQYDYTSLRKNQLNTPPPPPPPSSSEFISIHPRQSTANFNDIDFSGMALDELKAISPSQLDSLSLHQRNQYSSRLKELTLLNQMSKKEKKAYLERKAAIQQQNLDRKKLVANLNDLSNPLFKKMKELADKSSIVGRGTLGRIESKTVFIHCHNCNKTTKVLEKEKMVCTFCQTPLSHR